MMLKLKKLSCLVVCMIVAFSSVIYASQQYAYADNGSESIQVEIEESVEDQLNNLDLSQIENALSEIYDQSLFDGQSFSYKIKNLINGNIDSDSGTILTHIANLFVDDIVKFLPSICIIIAIAVLYSMLGSVASENKSSNIIHIVCFGCIAFIVVNGVIGLINATSACLSSIKTQMNAVFPVLLTLLTALGGTTSVGVYQPSMALLSSLVINLFTSVLLPIFIFKIVFTVISNLCSDLKFNKFADFFGSSFKWIIGIILTVFSAFVSINGFMAGTVDGISIRTAKYTIKSGIPIIGGFLSDGMGIIMISSSLIKNAVGVGGLILMLSTILLPLVNIIVFSFLLKLTGAILEPIADKRITNFVSDISKTISLATTLILGVGFMYFILVGLVMCSANIF